MSWVVLSEYVPTTVNCCVVPSAIEGLAGVMDNDTNTAGVTVSVVLAEIPVAGSVALISTLPSLTLVAKPSLPEALLTAAMPLSAELHVT